MAAKTLLLIALLFALYAPAQTCTAPGQNPSTAFPVCGTTVFSQSDVPICGVRNMIVPCNDNAGYQDKNPFWYKFTCFVPGSLLFTITPMTITDDYDWQLFDITGHNPDEVYTNASLFVSNNWSGYGGVTGTNLTNTNLTSCSGNNPIFSKAPTLIQGHEYLLLISHFTDGSQSGYHLSFTGSTGLNGTASITDTTLPRQVYAVPSCDARRITVKLSKKMKCNSLATNASDFSLSPAVPNNFVSAAGAGCSTGFDTDSITLTLNSPLSPGNYQLIIKSGNDGNTLLDNCSLPMPVGNQVPLIIAANQPTPFDSLAPVGCAPQKLRVVLKQNIYCNSIAPDASDFIINGAPAATATAAAGTCDTAGFTKSIIITLNQPLQTAGSYQLVLRKGTDGNTIINECGEETPAGATINFTTKDTVSADFTYQTFLSCTVDSIHFFHDGRNGITSWAWLFDSVRNSRRQDTTVRYTIFGQKTARLIVSNGICTDTAFATINLDNYLEAAFASPVVLCPKDSAYFTDKSIGKIKAWYWDFGNAATSSRQNPPAQLYPMVNVQQTFTVQLIVEDTIGCRDTLAKPILLVTNCYIDVPTAFTPNGDGKNDFFYPLNAYKATNLDFKVYNRYGQLVWQTADWTRKWDGTIDGKPAPTGTFVWYLNYTHVETKQTIHLQGTVVLIR